ncbi:MAG: fimbria/pilus periplasmic chaperone [Aliidongia sp.]|jgi:fimbrial chaperone protein
MAISVHWRSALAGVALFAPLPAISEIAAAQSLEVAPVTIELAAGAMATTLSVTNHGTETTPIQVRAFVWDQQDGVDHLTTTDDLMASPPIAQVAPEGTQVIRLVLHRPVGTIERSFRLLIDQIPSAEATGTVRFALRLSIPVFAEPSAHVAATLIWRVANLGNGRGELIATDTGGRHTKIRDAGLASADGDFPAIGVNVAPYVLAGATRRWPIILEHIPSSTPLHLTAATDSGRVDRILTIGDAP